MYKTRLRVSATLVEDSFRLQPLHVDRYALLEPSQAGLKIRCLALFHFGFRV